uniref:Reverse transcriptase Ty1/copia-type domain-containing protein n=1 Tax=Solanum lycopersicum TaxID=4081 RepID=A0A3Q7IW23_SOLLC
MKDLGNLNYFLGVHVVRTLRGLHLSQQKYIVDLLLKFHMHTCKPVRTPIASHTCIALEDGTLLSVPIEYRNMVGALQYLTMTLHDIAYEVNIVPQFMHAPRTTHLHYVKRIFRYLQGTPTHGLFLRWAGFPDTRRSMTVYAVFLGSNLISWRAKKQPTISKSSTEAEYRAIAYIVAETTWIHHLLSEYGIYLHVCRNPAFHDRFKHIEVDFHYVRDKVSQGDLLVKYVPTRLQVADIFTKGLSFSQFSFLHDNLSVTTSRPY